MRERADQSDITEANVSSLPALFPAQTRSLVFEAGGKRLIDDVDLTLQHGSITVVMGANGAGKSLLLRLLHGLLKATSGDVLWGGRAMCEAIRRRQAMVFQQPVMLRRTVAANIDFVLKLRGAVQRERRDELLEMAGLAAFAQQPARALSGGEQQRLALVRALAAQPDVLFLDEPTASLDPASISAIERLVRLAYDDGAKIIFVTHAFGQAKRLADDVVFMHGGRLVEQGPAKAFFDNPRSREAQDYLDGRLVF
jgi:tungstate transport system ATP-binding protein